MGRAGRRSTPRKRALVEALAATDAFLTAAQLHRAVRERVGPGGMGVGVATIYRNLADLAALGHLDVLVDDERGEHRYRLRRRDGHHHYLVCRICGRAVEVVSEPVEQWADTVGAALGFSDVSHSVELFGDCDHCQDRAP